MGTDQGNSLNGLFGRTRQAVLGLLLLRPDERFHVRQIARLIGTGLGAVQRELAALAEAGILRREKTGVQVYFQAEQACPYFRELQGLVTKTTGAVYLLREVLLPVVHRIKVALVFGSLASGKMIASSDVDLLVLSDDLKVRDLAGAIRRAGEALGREININLYRTNEWAQRVSQGHPLAKSILNNPHVLIIGDENEFRAMG